MSLLPACIDHVPSPMNQEDSNRSTYNSSVKYGPGGSMQPPNGDWNKVLLRVASLTLLISMTFWYLRWHPYVCAAQVYESLHECCSYGLVGEAEKLVKNGKFTVNSPDKDGNFPLHWASNGDHLHVIEVGVVSCTAYDHTLTLIFTLFQSLVLHFCLVVFIIC